MHHIINPDGRNLAYAFDLKPGMILSVADDKDSAIVAITKMDGGRLAFIVGGPDENTAVAIEITFHDHPPIISHPRTMFYYRPISQSGQ